MGVVVEKANSYRCCNSCNSKDEVIEITALMLVGNSNQGTQIALCKSCAQLLRSILNNRYEVRGEQDDSRTGDK